MAKIILKKNIRYKYNRNYVNKLSNKHLSFSRTSYIDIYDDITVESINKKTFKKLLRILNKFVGSSYVNAIAYLKNIFLKNEDFNYFLKIFFTKYGDIPRKGKFYNNNGKLSYCVKKRSRNIESKSFTKKELVYNKNVKMNPVGMVYDIDNVKVKNSDYFKIRYIGKFYVLVDGNVELRKVYHVPFLDTSYYYEGTYFENDEGIYSRVHGLDDYLIYRKGTVDYYRFKAAVEQFKPVKIYTTVGKVDCFSDYYYTKKVLDEKTGNSYDVIYNLGFGKLNLAIYNNK